MLGSWLENQASARGGNIPRIPKRSAADEDRDESETQGELGQASSAHDSSFCAPPPAPSQLWAGMGGFIVYHPLYTTNGDKSQEGERNSRMDRQLGFLRALAQEILQIIIRPHATLDEQRQERSSDEPSGVGPVGHPAAFYRTRNPSEKL